MVNGYWRINHLITILATYHFGPTGSRLRCLLDDKLAELANSTPLMGFREQSRIYPTLLGRPDHLCPGGVG